MRNGCLALLIAAGVGLVGTSGASALPVGVAGLDSDFAKHSLVTQARVYCMNRYTGQFLHWGPCGGPGWDGPRWHERHEWREWRPEPWRHHHHWGY